MSISNKIKSKLYKYSKDNLLDNIIVGEVIDVPFINQSVEYPTGCESVSVTSVLQYYGIDISVDTFIDYYLPKTELKLIGYDKSNDRILSSMHPNDYFIGNPKNSNGLGCYEKTIEKAVNSLLKDYHLEDFYTVKSYTELSLKDIQIYLDNNIPVIMWVTQNLIPSEKGLKWYLGNTKEIFQYMKNEHCMVAIGYDDTYIYFNDTLKSRMAYPKDLVMQRYFQMGARTVIIEYHNS